jgi:hypothetical protein
MADFPAPNDHSAGKVVLGLFLIAGVLAIAACYVVAVVEIIKAIWIHDLTSFWWAIFWLVLAQVVTSIFRRIARAL